MNRLVTVLGLLFLTCLGACHDKPIAPPDVKVEGVTVGVHIGDQRLGDGISVSSYDRIELRVSSPLEARDEVLNIMLPTDQAEWSDQLRKRYGDELREKWLSMRSLGAKSSFEVSKDAFSRYLEDKRRSSGYPAIYGDMLQNLKILGNGSTAPN